MSGSNPQHSLGRSRRPTYVLFLLTCFTMLNVMDRQLLSVLIDPIKSELGVSDAAMGLLTGTSFAVLNVAAGIPIAVWADRGVRRTILALGLATWSAFTFLTGFARSYSEIFAIRVAVGVGEATGSGPAQSLLTDTFPPTRRTTALSILVMGGPLGSMVAFAGGGWLADLYGWRVAFMVFGLPGLMLAALIWLTVSEPVRGAFDRPAADGGGATGGDSMATIPFMRAIRFLVTVPAIRSLFFASGFHSIGMYSVLGWGVPYMTRVHDLSTTEAGLRLAVASGLFTALGTLAGGTLADRLTLRDARWITWQPALASLILLPFGIGFAFAPNGTLATVLLAPASFLAGSCFGPMYSAVQSLAAPQTRALAGTSVVVVNTILGLGLAPPLVGWLNDAGAASHGAGAIRYSLAAAMMAHLVSALFMLNASRTLRRDLEAKATLLEPAR